MKFKTKRTFFFKFNLSFKYFHKKILSFFSKPKFTINDEWFDEDLEKTKFDIRNKKITNKSFLLKKEF